MTADSYNKYFITGGAGFIGSHLVDHLIEENNEVTVYDDLSLGSSKFIEQHFGKSNFHFVNADLFDFDTLSQSITGHDFIFHLAANPDIRAGTEKTDLDLKQGILATYNVLEAMRLNNIKKIVFTSSGTVYGEVTEPVAENLGPLLPISLYGAGKLSAEGFISAFCHLFDMRAWIFRLANVVGTRCGHGVIFDFINKLRQDQTRLEVLGDGRQEKSYLHIDDCIDGILLGIERSQEQVNVLNLGTDSFTNVTIIAKTVIEAMDLSGVKIEYTGGERGWKGDVPQVKFDIRKIKQVGYKPKYSSDEAVRRAVWDILDK